MPSHPADELRRKGERPAPPFPPDHPVTPPMTEENRGGAAHPDAAFDEGGRTGNGVHPHSPPRPPIELED
jgi:hypothetical protein